jgi:hypothetical protein
VHRLREDGTLPGTNLADAVPKAESFVPGLPQGLVMALLTESEQAEYLEKLDEHGE